jgi:hypothetical protein
LGWFYRATERIFRFVSGLGLGCGDIERIFRSVCGLGLGCGAIERNFRSVSGLGLGCGDIERIFRSVSGLGWFYRATERIFRSVSGLGLGCGDIERIFREVEPPKLDGFSQLNHHPAYGNPPLSVQQLIWRDIPMIDIHLRQITRLSDMALRMIDIHLRQPRPFSLHNKSRNGNSPL